MAPRIIGRVRPPRVTRPGQPTSRYPGGRLPAPNRPSPRGVHIPGGPGGRGGDQHGPPLVRGGGPGGSFTPPVVGTVRPPAYTGPQPDSNYSHGNQGGPATKPGEQQPPSYHQPGKKPPKPGDNQYQKNDRFARLKSLRKKAGITKYELEHNAKLNKLAGDLGVRSKPAEGEDKPPKRDFADIKALIKKIRTSDLNPEGRNFRPGLQKDRQVSGKKTSIFEQGRQKERVAKHRGGQAGPPGGRGSSHPAYQAYLQRKPSRPLSYADWVKLHRNG